MSTWTIYCMTNPDNGYKYIGQTSRKVDYRINEHLYEALRGSDRYFYKILRESKVTFEVSILKEGIESLSEANYWEAYYISLYNTYIENDNCHGYNSRPGGANSSALGTHIVAYNLDGTFYKKYKSVADAAREIGISPENIFRAANNINNRNIAGGYQWRRDGSTDTIADIRIDKKYLYKIKAYSNDNQFIGEFNNLAEAARNTNTPYNILYNAIMRGEDRCCHCNNIKWISENCDKRPEDIIVYKNKVTRAVNLYKIADNPGIAEYIGTFETASDAAKYLGCTHSSILNACNKLYGHNNYKNYIIDFDTVENRHNIKRSNLSADKKRIVGVKLVNTIDGHEKLFNTLKEAAEYLGISRHTVKSSAISGKIRNGYIVNLMEE